MIDLIERKFPSQRTVTKLERVIAVTSGNGERFMTKPDERRETGTALRLQSQEDTGCFQNRRLAFAIRAEKKIKSRRELEGERFEAAEILQAQFGEHERSTITFRAVRRVRTKD